MARARPTAKKPAFADKTWCLRYAEESMRLKHPSTPWNGTLRVARSAIELAYKTVYRAVAFDIDGTLTRDGSSEIDEVMAHIIGSLLRRSIPVLLVTGRGRGSARKAARTICDLSELSRWYTRRLYCITHNGVFLLQTPAEDPSSFLARESLLSEQLEGLPHLRTQLEKDLHAEFQHLKLEFSTEPHSVRIVAHDARRQKQKLRLAIERIVRTATKTKKSSIYVSLGSYGKATCFDIAATNKHLALEQFAREIGVRSEQIIRIGDQGQVGGNDHDLLNSPHGFSVDRFDHNPGACHPIFSEDFTTRLRGSDATKQVLRDVLLFAPLSIEPEPAHLRLPALRTFERMAVRRSRQEAENVESRLRVRLRYLLPEGDDIASLHSLRDGDIFDPQSGAVRFRDWELDAIKKQPHFDATLALFGLKDAHSTGDPKLPWCMYSDTGLLMRGPRYYYAMTHKDASAHPCRYPEDMRGFLSGVPSVLREFQESEASLARFKLLLGVCDNIRNYALNLQYAAFLAEGARLNSDFSLTRDVLKNLLLPHTALHYRLLMDPDTDWYALVEQYTHIVHACEKITARFVRAIQDGSISSPPGKSLWRNWRECDHFLQNVTAAQLGLHELRNRPDIRDLGPLSAVGLVYGGTEMPAISRVVADARGFALNVGFLAVSIYGNRDIGQQIREGRAEYVREMLLKQKHLVLFDKDGQTIDADGQGVILVDDNCTTCVTLQLARDVLVLLGADVLGAITVRFPGGNRHVQMAMRGHGYPDPEALFGFIRGLISPSPYTRLMYANPKAASGKEYLDQTGGFDKARARIERYLRKNGTPAIE